MNENDKKWIIYKITNDIDNTYYIGLHKTNIDIDDGYRGNGFLIKRLIKKYGIEHFKRETLYTFETLEEAAAKEYYLINNDLLQDPLCLNLTYGGGCGWSLINKQIQEGNISYTMKDNLNTNYKNTNNWVTYNNGFTNIKIRDDLRSFWLPIGFKLGKLQNKKGHKIKILIVPDLHSKRYILDKFIKIMIKDEKLQFDQVIFLGDYIDGFVETNQDMLYCLNTVIKLKKKYKEKIILLLANHEFSYLGQPCSGHRFDIENIVSKILNDNKEFFQICYAINDCIFSHAGLTNSWVNNTLDYPLSKINRENYDKNFKIQNLTNYINNNLLDLSEPGFYRSGGSYIGPGSCIWSDRKELLLDNLLDCHQVVGHTPIPSVELHKLKQNKVKSNYICFTDTFSTYRNGEIIGDLSYLVYCPLAQGPKEDKFEIHYLN